MTSFSIRSGGDGAKATGAALSAHIALTLVQGIMAFVATPEGQRWHFVIDVESNHPIVMDVKAAPCTTDKMSYCSFEVHREVQP